MNTTGDRGDDDGTGAEGEAEPAKEEKKRSKRPKKGKAEPGGRRKPVSSNGRVRSDLESSTGGKADVPKGTNHDPKPRATGLNVNWEAVDLADIKHTDHTFQYRLGVTTSDLRRSLETDGQEEPIDLLRGSGKPYKILDGFRRCAAALELGWSAIMAFIHNFDEDKAIRFAFIKNVVRKSMTPMERAHALWVAQKKGFSSDELPGLFGLSPKQVGRYLNLLKFPDPIQKCLDGKVLTMAHAKVLADFQIENPADWKDRIAKEELDARALRRLVAAEKGRKALGRRRKFITKIEGGLQGYRFTITRNSPREEREALCAALLAALKFLERDLD